MYLKNGVQNIDRFMDQHLKKSRGQGLDYREGETKTKRKSEYLLYPGHRQSQVFFLAKSLTDQRILPDDKAGRHTGS